MLFANVIIILTVYDYNVNNFVKIKNYSVHCLFKITLNKY